MPHAWYPAFAIQEQFAAETSKFEQQVVESDHPNHPRWDLMNRSHWRDVSVVLNRKAIDAIEFTNLEQTQS